MRTPTMLRLVRLLAAAAVLVTSQSSCLPAVSGMSVEFAYVQPAPPVRRVEVITRAPGPGFVWVEGYWGWQSRTYVWVPGRWERPPKRHAHWSPGRWRHHDRGWYWVPGHWR